MQSRMMIGFAIAIMAFAAGCRTKKAAEPAAPEAAKPAAAPAGQAMICIEAEDFKACVKKGDLAWIRVTKPEGFSGKGAMQAMPNDNVLNDEGMFVDDSPRMDYEVDFPKAGTWYVWVRGYGETEEDNSCHIGLDGKALDSADKIAEFDPEWTWTSDSKDFERPTLKVDAPGKRVLNVWMREDGFVIDRIVLTLDPKFTPSGKGP